MKKTISKTEAKKKIDNFFSRKEFKPEEVKKIKRLAMKYKIRLGNYRKLFCKKCYSQLYGKFRVSKINKSIKCGRCGFMNKHRISNIRE